MKKQTKIETIDELFEEIEDLEKEAEEGLENLKETVELITGEKITINKIELKELEELPFGAIY